MANSSHAARVRKCAPLLSFIIAVLAPFAAHAQHIEKYYTANAQANGTLYYIIPAGGFSGAHGSSLTYDITCLSSSDSARLTFSYLDKATTTIDSMVLLTGDGRRTAAPTTRLFVAPKKRRFEYRYSATFPVSALTRFFAQQSAPEIMLVTAGGPSAVCMGGKAWRKRAAIVSRIFSIILLNK